MNKTVLILALFLIATLADSQTMLRRAGRKAVPAVAQEVAFSDVAYEDQSTTQVATKQWAHTVAGNYLIVGIGGKSARVVDSVKVWTGEEAKISLTELKEVSAQVPMCCLYGVANPPIGVDSIKVWFLSNCYSLCLSASYTGVNTSAPIGTPQFDSATGTAVSSVVVATSTNDLVVCIVTNKDTKTFAPTATDMVERRETAGGNMGISLCDMPGVNGNVTLTGNMSNTATPWKIIGVALKAP